MAVTEHRIAIVGMGPGAPELVTPAARRALMQADLLVGARRLLALAPDSPAERFVVDANIDAGLTAVEAAHPAKKVAVLVSGDPGLLSLARPVLTRFGRAQCEIIPGISSVQVAFARVALEWADARVLDAHGRVPETLATALVTIDKLAVLLGCARAGSWLQQLASTLQASHTFLVCQHLTLAEEVVRELDPTDVPALATTRRSILLAIRKELLLS